ncbi:UbiA-like polyprenyltransferase [Archaeoglobus fulgidus]|uniref:4-hydroxybenzoate octaprenyltransferase (UbiA) n=1 Tax=Archaeoglobus fulgidus (strain ATCC 49558 / DSM 4304 / JCM 9628 / NBRC 100126 / VC-16) TaxID=224325 RepID=O28106_ARCFU|nr:UbiA-like polyprenyltransferase [Archaeoglobus fulgidus]AAB89072.1 4-hydroxybenzoate octaprenyltransferase (ubiA) [Archaeoglobus fulgidus DSM 4304]
MQRIKMYLDFIKIEHTLFALPFAYAGAFLAEGGLISLRLAFLILTAFTGLRTAAMTFNRIIDREIDAKNPRTAMRHLPAGLISLKEAYTIAFLALAIYFISAALINKTALMLSPIPAITAYIYPYLKRFTCLCHYVLGLNLAFAPLGGWIAVTDSIDIFGSELVPTLIGVAVMFWVAGFDMIYGLQDVDFDRSNNLHSIGAHFGVRAALWLSRLNHVIFFALIAIALQIHNAKLAELFLPLIALLLFYEHYIVRDGYDEAKIQIAFFYVNALVSSALLAAIFADAIFSKLL